MEASSMPTDRGMDKEVVVHIHSGILLGSKKECIWASCKEADGPEPIIQSDVSQKEKDRYRILMHINRMEKDGTDNPTG